MKIFLKVMVILLLLASIAALTFGVLLFNKRELLKGRTQRLEKAIKEFDAVIEAEPATKAASGDLELDLSPCDAEIPESLEFNDFWGKYKYDLEAQSDVMVSTSTRDKELMAYFLVDAAGNKRIKGPGTMDNVLVELRTKAEEQYNRLNETREQLTDLRSELIATIEKHNDKMMDHRKALIEIKALEEEIESLKSRISELEEKIAELEALITPLKDQIAEQERIIAGLEESNTEKDREIENLQKQVGEKSAGQGDTTVVNLEGRVEPGIKGDVILVNPEWQFCIFRLTDEFFDELTGGDPSADIPQIELWVKRPGKDGAIVTKLRMLQVRREDKMATADILDDWQQMPVKAGDLVFFQ